MGHVALLKEEGVLASWCNKIVFSFSDGPGDKANLYNTDAVAIETVNNVLLILFFFAFFLNGDLYKPVLEIVMYLLKSKTTYVLEMSNKQLKS